MSKHSVIILGLYVVTTRWSWAWTNRTSPSNGVGLGSPLAACSMYGDLTCCVHTVNSLCTCMFNCHWHAYCCNWGPYVRLLSSWNKIIIIIIMIGEGSNFQARIKHRYFRMDRYVTWNIALRPFNTDFRCLYWNFHRQCKVVYRGQLINIVWKSENKNHELNLKNSLKQTYNSDGINCYTLILYAILLIGGGGGVGGGAIPLIEGGRGGGALSEMQNVRHVIPLNCVLP